MKSAWRSNELEAVMECPYCGSGVSTEAFGNVEDWSFGAVSGKWKYHECSDCHSLYLNPRPKESTIGRAYSEYYTHASPGRKPLAARVKERLKNDWLTYLFECEFLPRFHLPALMIRCMAFLLKKEEGPFGWMELKGQEGGRLIDIGCGAGLTVLVAKKLGWDALGLEIDSDAVKSARGNGIEVIEGSFHELENYAQSFDCIICSHVLEHVYNPRELLKVTTNALKSGGKLVLSLPNATSAVGAYFGKYWRGLEAPRHISIPSQLQLIKLLKSHGFSITSHADTKVETAIESFKIKRMSPRISFWDRLSAMTARISPNPGLNTNDFIKLVCVKNGAGTEKSAETTS